MKIAFAGTHVTGKTTLLMDYLQYIHMETENGHDMHSFGYITGIARNIIARGYPLNKDGNVDSYINYINDQLEAEKRMTNFDDFISDRTLLDPLAYSLVNKSLPRPYIPDYLISMIKNIWLIEKNRYDLYVYFPIEFPMSGIDDIHPSDKEYRERIDKKIYSLLKEHNVKHIFIHGSREQRLNELVKLLNE